jgi:hypothetical protein
MFLQIDRDEELLLARLVAARLQELEEVAAGPRPLPPNRACELETLRRLAQRLVETEYDVTC